MLCILVNPLKIHSGLIYSLLYESQQIKILLTPPQLTVLELSISLYHILFKTSDTVKVFKKGSRQGMGEINQRVEKF